MTERDNEILKTLKNFYVLDRDQLIQMFFKQHKQPITCCNRVMNRLVLQGLVKVDRTARPYNYFHHETKMKLDSQKIPHYKSIAQVYLDLCEITVPTVFEVEPKLGKKGTVEVDVYAVWNGAPMYIEKQRTRYTLKVMNEKINRYRDYADSKTWRNYTESFPYILMLSDTMYDIDNQDLAIYQAKDVKHFIQKYF